MAKEKKTKERIRTPRIEDEGQRKTVTAILAILSFVFLYMIAVGYVTNSAIYDWIIALLFLLIIGIVIREINGYAGFYGMYLLSTKHGIDFIDSVANSNKNFWIQMSMWGIVLGFGLLSYPLLKGRISKKQYAFGIVSLLLIMLYVIPATANGLQFINLPQLQTAVQNSAGATPNYLLLYVVYGFTLLAGFSGYIISLLWYNAGLILLGVAQFLASATVGMPNTSTLTNQLPGVAPLIPGLQIPLVAGILSLAILLIIHEGAHGVLSRIEKIKLNSVGLLLFGVVPIGAFVEPDEKSILKLDSIKQSRIFSAGVSANFVAMIFFFVIMSLMIAYVVPGIYQIVVTSTAANYPAYNVLHPGEQVLYWNGQKINSISNLENASAADRPGSTVTVTTNVSTYTFTAIANGNSTHGLIGVNVGEAVQNTPYANVIYFIYSLITLSFLLNFLIGVVNLLPVPAFDGWRIYGSNIKNGKVMVYLAYFIVIGILINALPWLFMAL